MIYSFDGAIANEVGVSAAVVFHHIAHWIKFNEAHEQNFINGKYWMYDTVANMQKFLNFYTDRTIKNSIGKLVEADYLVRDNLSQDKYNHTKWYALTEKGMAYANLNNNQKCKFDREKISQSTIKQRNTNKGIQQRNTTDDPFCTGSPALDDALHGFEEMRKKLRKPLTDRAKRLTLGKLEKLAPGDEAMQVAILDQSVERGWQGVFPLKPEWKQERNEKYGLHGDAGEAKSEYAAYFDGDT